MRRRLFLRAIILFCIIITASLILLITTNFSEHAVINVVSTLGAVVLLGIIISHVILRKNK